MDAGYFVWNDKLPDEATEVVKADSSGIYICVQICFCVFYSLKLRHLRNHGTK